MNKFGRGYFGFLRTLVLTSAILFASAIGATSGGANSAAARSISQVQPTTPHESPEPDVGKARIFNNSTEYSFPSQLRENRPKASSQADTDQPSSEEIDDPAIGTHNVTVLDPGAEEKFITESWYSYAPGLDDFRSADWLNMFSPELGDCRIKFKSENATFGQAIDLIADHTGINPRVLLLIYILQSSVSSTATSCQEAQKHLNVVSELADEMGQLSLFYRYGNEESDLLFTSSSFPQRRGFFHNDVSFAVAHATTAISAGTDKLPQEVTTEFYRLFKQYFGDPGGAPPYLLSDEAINSVTYLMPFYTGERPYTSGHMRLVQQLPAPMSA